MHITKLFAQYLPIKYLLLAAFIAPFANSRAQSVIKLDLSQAVNIAQSKSYDYKIALYTARSAYWSYENYKANFLPKLTLKGYLPNYYQSINEVTATNGQVNFVNQNVAASSLFLNLSQNIGFTGGNLAIGSSLSRIDNFGLFDNTSYTAVPISLSYSQNNLFYNDYKWERRIEPLKLIEAQRGYLENIEDISYTATTQYFNLLQASIQLKLDQQNLKNIDTLVKVTNARAEIGTVQLNNLLQVKVSLLNARSAVSNSILGLETARQSFVKYLDLDKTSVFELDPPDSLAFFSIVSGDALAKAQNNRKNIIEFRRRKLEAEQAVARTKAETGPSISINANIGLTQTGNTIDQAYDRLLRNQSFLASLNIPILDWGVNRSNRKRAEANLNLEISSIAQQELAIEQEIIYQVLKWNTQKEQLDIAKETRALSMQRYEISKQKYAIGTISFTDFNDAQLDKDRATIAYINGLKTYWSIYYLLRKLTLFDFHKNKDILFTDILLNDVRQTSN